MAFRLHSKQGRCPNVRSYLLVGFGKDLKDTISICPFPEQVMFALYIEMVLFSTISQSVLILFNMLEQVVIRYLLYLFFNQKQFRFETNLIAFIVNLVIILIFRNGNLSSAKLGDKRSKLMPLPLL